MTIKHTKIKLLFWLTVFGLASCGAVLSSLYLYLSPKLPAVESLRGIKLQTPLRIFSSEGLLIGEFGEKRRSPISFDEAPAHFINALLAAEDASFYSHNGVDFKGLLRAVSQLLQSGQIQTGGSTITMQVARNFFLTRNQTFSRKFNEILLALQIENELSKEEILELYINKIYLGNRAYGIESASQVYYGKPIGQLNLSQLAMIAGLPKAPSAYNPIVNPSRATVRRNWILGRMLSLEMIDVSSYNESITSPVTAEYHGTKLELDAPYIAEMARRETLERLGDKAYTDGYKVHTTIDIKLQKQAQQAVISGLLDYDQRHGYRGVEGNLLPTEKNSQLSKPFTLDEITLTSWVSKLSKVPELGGLQPAVITQVSSTSLTALLNNHESISLEVEQASEFLRPYINENKRGTQPKDISSTLKVGDIIRVIKSDTDSWHLTQVPLAQAALVSIDPNNGHIKSLVGGFDFKQSHFNRATQAERQPGSNFKPFIYNAALEGGLTPATLINDAPIVFNDSSLENTWRPENSSGKFFGPTRLRQALYKSRNLVSIRVLRSTGIQNTISGMDRFGFDPKKLPKDLSLALGSHALTPLQVAGGYTVFANGGYKVKPLLISRITDSDDNIIFQADSFFVCKTCLKDNSEPSMGNEKIIVPLESAAADDTPIAEKPDPTTDETPEPETPSHEPQIAERVISPQVAYLIDDMLRDVIQKGTGRKAKVLGRNDLAGKTGTTNGPKDAWFSGYNYHLVTTTWLGFDQNYALGRREYGGTSALPIWINYMKVALDGIPEKVRELPAGLVSVRIDPTTGKRAAPGNTKAIFELFRAENIPSFAEDIDPINIISGEKDSVQAEDLF
jgi:penicillin-binding protein 1A